MKARFTLWLALALVVYAPGPARAGEPGLVAGAKWAFGELKAGNRRFVIGKPAHPAQDAESRRKLIEGQKPYAIVLACSDSRVAPELVFDQGLGQLFTVRVAGNIADPATVASIEYAVEKFGVSLIVVMGHESCDAIKFALETPPGTSAGSRDLDTLVSVIRPNLGSDRSIASRNQALRGAARSNVDAVAQDLTVRSKIIRSRLELGKLAIVPAIYSLESSLVEFWGIGNLE